MDFIRGRLNLARQHRGCVATIGNFDGVHRGHRAVIAQLRRRAAELGRASMVVEFEPQPQEYFRGHGAPARLTPLRDKLALFAELGVDYLLCLRFNRALAQTHAGDFVRDILVDALGVRHLVVGDDFRFGHQRSGDFSTLQAAGRRFDFSVEAADTLALDGARVSSTRIRAALANGEFESAGRLLGRPFRINGRVIHGDRRGREWGFPTANIAMGRRRLPFTGIFAVDMSGVGEARRHGVASIGVRPTVPGQARALLEVYLFDFEGELYGRHVSVGFLDKIRDEQRFETFAALRQQIARDVEDARRLFENRFAKTGMA